MNTKDEFTMAWESLPDHAAEVYMMFHSGGNNLIFEEGDYYEAYSVSGENSRYEKIGKISDLSPKDISTLYVLGCNSGNLKLARDQGKTTEDYGNVAQAFSLLTGGSVWGIDGELAYGSPIAMDEYNSYFPRLSNDQGHFHEISGLLSSPQGYVEYQDGIMSQVHGELPSPFSAIVHWALEHGE